MSHASLADSMPMRIMTFSGVFDVWCVRQETCVDKKQTKKIHVTVTNDVEHSSEHPSLHSKTTIQLAIFEYIVIQFRYCTILSKHIQSYMIASYCMKSLPSGSSAHSQSCLNADRNVMRHVV